MKRLISVAVILSLVFLICSCSKVTVSANDDVFLTFIYGDENISVALEAHEAEKIIDIIDGSEYDPFYSGTPSCGFDKNVSLKVGNKVFAIALDTCNVIQNLGNLRFFSVSDEDMEYIHSLFRKYGGYFPCI